MFHAAQVYTLVADASRYFDKVYFEETDVLNDDWIVLLNCGHVLVCRFVTADICRFVTADFFDDLMPPQQKNSLKGWLETHDEMGALVHAACTAECANGASCGTPIAWQDLKVRPDSVSMTVFESLTLLEDLVGPRSF